MPDSSTHRLSPRGAIIGLAVILAVATGTGLYVGDNYACGCSPPKPEAKAWPMVTGTTTVGSDLTTTDGTWVSSGTLAAYPVNATAYQWQQCDGTGTNCSNIGGATSNSYTLAAGDATHTVRAVVTATNAGGNTSQASLPTGATWPTGWRAVKTAVAYLPTVTLASSPEVTITRGAAADNAMADLMGLYVEYTPGAGPSDHQMVAGTVSEADSANALSLGGGGAIAVSQIEFHYSGSGGTANPELSLGGAIAAGTVTLGAANNVWKDVTDAERQSGKDYYSCLFVKNTHPSDLWQSVTLWIDDPEDQGTTSIGLDPGSIGGTAVTVANVNTAPAGVTFGQPASKAAGTVIGDIPAGSYKAFWERRSFPAAGTAMASDAISVRVEGNTVT